MAKKITARTKIKVGDLIAWQSGGELVVYQVAKVEKQKRGTSPCICLNKSPGDKEFIRENKVDWYTRIHQSDLVKNQQAEIISVIELIVHYERARINAKYNNERIRNLIAERDAVGCYNP